MINLTLETFKANWKRYAWSSFITFVSSFVVAFALLVNTVTWDSLEKVGWVGALLTIGRLLLKACLEGFKALVTYIAEKSKK